ncbi:MAG TPA: DUF2244 domain-containing protein [Rhizomicrobium sp.]|jgi:uncharacterized membrane protein|nr:DUF2244 domain-containing protein [Rhizomicrobium sp.]
MSEPIILEAVLRPSPPLPPRVLLWILGFVAFINLLFAGYFVWHGAWPVMPFLGLDVALLAWAFRKSTLNAKREERVTLTPEELHIACVPPKGAAKEVSLNPYWVRVDMDDPAEHWSQITLWSRGRGWRIGAFLAPAERVRFAAELKDALRAARDYRWA